MLTDLSLFGTGLRSAAGISRTGQCFTIAMAVERNDFK